MRRFETITKALADESRLRIIMALRRGELCVCRITELLELAPSTVSKHVSILRQAGLIESRKDGRWVFYRLADGGSAPGAKKALRLTIESLERDGGIQADERRLRQILKIPPEEICKKRCKK